MRHELTQAKAFLKLDFVLHDVTLIDVPVLSVWTVCNVGCSLWVIRNAYKLDCYEDLSSDYMSVSDHGFVVNINFTLDQASKYQSITIHGVKERLYHDVHGLCEVDEEEPTFFSVYLRDHEGLSHCFGDCGKLKLPVLRQLAESLANEHGWSYIDCTTQNHP